MQIADENKIYSELSVAEQEELQQLLEASSQAFTELATKCLNLNDTVNLLNLLTLTFRGSIIRIHTKL